MQLLRVLFHRSICLQNIKTLDPQVLIWPTSS